MEFYGWVIVQKRKQSPISHDKRTDHLATVDGFFPAVDHPRFHQFADTVADHLGMDSDILVRFQRRQHRIGYAPDTQLES